MLLKNSIGITLFLTCCLFSCNLTVTFQMVSNIILYLTYKRVFYQVWLFIIAETISIKVAILLTKYIEKLFCKPKPTQPVNTATAIHFLHWLNFKNTRTLFFSVVPTEVCFPGKENTHMIGKGKIDCICAHHYQGECPVSSSGVKKSGGIHLFFLWYSYAKGNFGCFDSAICSAFQFMILPSECTFFLKIFIKKCWSFIQIC